MNRQSVMIISGKSGQARDLVDHWQMERQVPDFTLLGPELWNGSGPAASDLAIVLGSGMPEPALLRILLGMDGLEIPCICLVGSTATAQQVRQEFPRVLVLREDESWLQSVVVLGGEVLRRVEAQERVRRSDALASTHLGNAALGKYMLEARHSFNNALTAVLGNAELLLLEPGQLTAETMEKVDTIHSMALRLHEMMQRFSSLDSELRFTEKESQVETKWVAKSVS